MNELYVLGLSGIVGLLIGTFYKYKPTFNRPNKKLEPIIRRFSISEIPLDKQIFDLNEIQFIQQLIHGAQYGNNVSTMNLVEILELQELSAYTKRVECNNFLKSLNLKILVKYGFKEAILTLGTETDKRKKCYLIDSNFLQQLSTSAITS